MPNICRTRTHFGPRRLALVVLAACGLVSVLPATGNAAVTVGSSLPAPTEAWVCDGGDPAGSPTSDAGDFPCVLIQDRINGAFVEGPSGRGVITRWTVRGASGTIALRVMQAIEPYEPGKVKGRMRNESVDVEAGGGTQSFSTRQRIYQADYLGLVLQSEGSQSGFSNVPHPNATELFEAPGAFNTNAFESTLKSNGELLYQVTVEPDANDNGCGDQTQESLCAADPPDPDPDVCCAPDDPDPTDDPLAGLRAGGKPGMRILGKKMKVSKKGIVKVTVANPNVFRLRGRLSLKSKKLKVGAKSFSISGNEASRTVRIKLTKKAFRTLKRRRRMAVMATATGRGPIGKSRTVRKRLSIKAPARPKKKRRSTGGGGGGGGDAGLIYCPPHVKTDIYGNATLIPGYHAVFCAPY